MDLQAIRDRLAKLNNKSTGKAKVFKPKDEHDVRCLPIKGTDDPFVEKLYHFNIGETRVLMCPRNSGDDCEICEYAEKLRAWKDESGRDKPEAIRKKDFELFRKLQAAPRYHIAIVERGKEDDGPMWWQVTSKVFNKLLEICALEPYNRGRKDGGGSQILTSVDNGYDLHVSFKKPGQKGNKTSFFLTEVDDKRIATPLLDDAKKAKALLEQIPDFNETYPAASSREAKSIFMKFIEGGGEAGGDVSDGLEVSSKKSGNAEKLTGTKSIEEAFSDLLGNK